MNSKNVSSYAVHLYRYNLRVLGRPEVYEFDSDIKFSKEQLDLTIDVLFGLSSSHILVRLCKITITADEIKYKKERLFD